MTAADKLNKELVFTVHALDETSVPGAPVPARLFNAKCRAIIAALEEADRSVSADRRHEFFVTKLGTGKSAVIGLSERPAKAEAPPFVSSVDTFLRCADALYRGNFADASKFNGLAEKVLGVVKDAGEKFSYMEFEAEYAPTVRGDEFLKTQAERFIASKKVDEAKAAEQVFCGQSFEGFDGEIKEVDLRGAQPHAILILSGSRVSINCVFKGLSSDQIRECLDRRVWAEGFAIYTGRSPMPECFEITKPPTVIKQDGNMLAWRGSVTPSDEIDWDSPFDQSH